MDNIVDRFYNEQVYTLTDLRDLFAAIHEGKIKTVVIENLGKSLTFDISTIVRCKDCKHRDPEDHKCDCGHDIQWQLPREDDWFCADGEPKEGKKP